ncbi:MAG: hypothetical protein WCG95_04970 [bacterium]
MNSSVANFLTKSVGTAALGLVLYDSHIAGKLEAPKYEKNHKAESLEKHFFNEQKLDSPSIIQATVKKSIFRHHVDENLSGFFTNIIGYVKGFGSMMIKNSIPLALVAGTILGGKGIFSKFCGAGLLAYGGIFLAQEMFGIGKE